MQINFIYDPSVASAPAGFTAALSAVAQGASLYFTDPITVNIAVGWGEVGGFPISPDNIASSINFDQVPPSITLTYAQLKTELMQHAVSVDDVIAITNMPVSNPFGGLFSISHAQAEAWGLVPANSTIIDGAIGFDSTVFWDGDQSNGISPNFYDFIAAASHEITETFGRAILPLSIGVLDLFRYPSPFGYYFSIDGGITNLSFFSTSGDFGDWRVHTPPDAFDASGTPGQVAQFTLTDFTVMDVLGFNLNFGNLNLSSANNVALPAQITYQQMYGVPPSATELWNLKVFDTAQSLYGQSIGVQNATVYMYQALGAALAEQSDTGSTAFKDTWGPQTIPSDTTFVVQAYANVFGVQGSQPQIQAFVGQVNFFGSSWNRVGDF